jgi:hypothetical protein
MWDKVPEKFNKFSSSVVDNNSKNLSQVKPCGFEVHSIRYKDFHTAVKTIYT